MDVNSILEHQSKEILKNIVSSTQGFSDRIKFDLKNMIDASRSLEDLAQAWLAYFATLNWR